MFCDFQVKFNLKYIRIKKDDDDRHNDDNNNNLSLYLFYPRMRDDVGEKDKKVSYLCQKIICLAISRVEKKEKQLSYF